MEWWVDEQGVQVKNGLNVNLVLYICCSIVRHETTPVFSTQFMAWAIVLKPYKAIFFDFYFF